MKSNFLNLVVVTCALLGSVWSICWADDPNEVGDETICTSILGQTSVYGSCPSWFWVFSRNGQDGGQLTVYLDACQITEYEHYSMPQKGGTGKIADLDRDDIFIEWDEDPEHGDGTEKYFAFTGIYEIAEPNDYVYVTTTDSQTKWTVYRVTGSGTLYKTGDCCNEHEAIHLNRYLKEFWKDDDVEEPNCVSPGDEFTYTICWDNAYGLTLEDVVIVDWLPDGVNYPAGFDNYVFDGNSIQIIEGDPGYNEEEHCYVWELGDIDPNEWGCVQLEVTVNENAESGGSLYNLAEMYLDDRVIELNDKYTQVCCWGDDPNILYVDASAIGENTGMSWDDAYKDLADALDWVKDTICGGPFTIYVAAGTYAPAGSTEDGFVLSDGVSVYGGFPAGGGTLNQRDLKKYKTVLTGYIDPNTRADTVVTMADETLLDGFTITESSAFGQGIYASDVDFLVENCKIDKNFGYGVYIEDGNATFTWCRIRNNDFDGIRHSGSGNTLTLENCWVQRNGQYGLYCLNSVPIVRNSNITESDLAKEGRAGIRLFYPENQAVLQNVTIAHNKTFGIWRTGGALPDVKNSIVYHNGGPALAGFSADDAASYSCIEDCNSVNNNISLDPMFVYFDPNNVRIMSDSPCHDSGLTLQENYDQVDMDGRERVLGIAVDRGAYEIECEDTSNSFDTNHDGLVNLYEFADFSCVWMAHDPNDVAFDPNSPSYNPDLTDPNSPDYVTPSSLAAWYPDGHKFNYDDVGDSEYVIDLADLMFWVEETPWLWHACWLTDDYLFQMMGGGEMLMMEGDLSSVIPAEVGIQPEISVAEQITQLTKSIILLEKIWLEDPNIQEEIDTETWQEFMDTLYQELVDLYMGND